MLFLFQACFYKSNFDTWSISWVWKGQVPMKAVENAMGATIDSISPSQGGVYETGDIIHSDKVSHLHIFSAVAVIHVGRRHERSPALSYR